MTLTPTPIGDNPFAPGIAAETYLPDQLIAGEFKIVTADATLLEGFNLVRGTVMGQQTIGGLAAAAKAGMTGNGTCVPDVVAPIQHGAKVGVYSAVCTVHTAGEGTFRLFDPDGRVLGDFVLAGGTVTITDEIKFVINAGGVDYIVGDTWLQTVAAGSGKYIPSIATALDGSQVPSAILVDNANSTSADQQVVLYLTCDFNSDKITFDVSWSVATLTPALRPFSIFLKSAILAADPSGE